MFVVGLGASAGGLDPFRQILKNIRKNSGMAYVLVQHISPHHASALPAILSRVAPIPVGEIEDGMRVRSDRIYVLPPNASVALSRGVLRVMPRIEVAGRPVCIDYFFQTLALERDRRAMGVLLSGTASDGVLGLKSIKAKGGITFAQSPDSADFAELPIRAIEAGCVDYVLPPDEIAGKIMQLSRTAAPSSRVPERSPLADRVEQIAGLLWSVDPAQYSPHEKEIFRRAFDRRMKASGSRTVATYSEKLRSDASEMEALYGELVARLAGFFRDPEIYDVLRRSVFPKILDGRATRIWVPGCSTGEEPYSLAVSLVEHAQNHGRRIPIEVFGTDVSDSNLRKARRGVYAASLFIGVSRERLARFFAPVNGSYRVNRSIREVCIFGRHDAVRDPPFPRLDLIFARTMTAWSDPDERRTLLSQFYLGLNARGFLVLGAGKSVDIPRRMFDVVDPSHRIFRKRQG